MNLKKIKRLIAANLKTVIENEKNINFVELYVKLLDDLLRD